MCHKNRRLPYLILFLVLLAVEICIALFVRDQFVRPYVGDLLVTALLCCLARVVVPNFSPAVPVFLFAAAVEGSQWLGLAEMLNLQGTVLGIILGATFDWKDLVCYGLGCLLFAMAERLCRKWIEHEKSRLSN